MCVYIYVKTIHTYMKHTYMYMKTKGLVYGIVGAGKSEM